MSTRLRYVVPLLATVLFLPLAQAQGNAGDCSHLVWNHSYANTFGGFLNLPLFFNFPDNGQVGLVPNAGAGVMTFLPNGVVQARETLMVGLTGRLQDLKMTGTYSLKWDATRKPLFCTGPVKLVAEGTPTLAYNFQMIVNADGRRVEMIHTDPGLIVDFVALPARTVGCRNSTLHGKYSYTTLGWGMLPDLPSDQTLAGYISGTMSGGMQFSAALQPPTDFPDAPAGSARVDSWDNLSISGVPMSRHMVGWYKVNPDCSGTITLRADIGFPEFTIEMFLGENADAIYAVNVNTFDPGNGSQIPMFLFPIPLQRVMDQRQVFKPGIGQGESLEK